MTEATTEDFLDDSKFQAMLAAVDNEPEEDAIEDDAVEEKAIGEAEEETAEADESEAEIDDAEEIEEEPSEEDKSIEKSVRYFKEQLRAESEKNAVLEHKYNELVKLVEEKFVGGQQVQEDTDYEPLDEIADAKYGKQFEELNKQQKQIIEQQQNLAFQNALAQAESQARSKYADFDDAFIHYTKSEAARFEALGYPEDQANMRAQQAAQTIARNAWNSGQNLGDLFYGFAKASGYQAKEAKAEPKKKGVNMDALAKNKARTERKKADTVTPTGTSHDSLIKKMNEMAKPGVGISDKDFAKLLQQVQ